MEHNETAHPAAASSVVAAPKDKICSQEPEELRQMIECEDEVSPSVRLLSQAMSDGGTMQSEEQSQIATQAGDEESITIKEETIWNTDMIDNELEDLVYCTEGDSLQTVKVRAEPTIYHRLVHVESNCQQIFGLVKENNDLLKEQAAKQRESSYERLHLKWTNVDQVEEVFNDCHKLNLLRKYVASNIPSENGVQFHKQFFLTLLDRELLARSFLEVVGQCKKISYGLEFRQLPPGLLKLFKEEVHRRPELQGQWEDLLRKTRAFFSNQRDLRRRSERRRLLNFHNYVGSSLRGMLSDTLLMNERLRLKIIAEPVPWSGTKADIEAYTKKWQPRVSAAFTEKFAEHKERLQRFQHVFAPVPNTGEAPKQREMDYKRPF